MNCRWYHKSCIHSIDDDNVFETSIKIGDIVRVIDNPYTYSGLMYRTPIGIVINVDYESHYFVLSV